MTPVKFLYTVVKDFQHLHFTMMQELKEITLAQLALRNGQDKPDIWIAYKGQVYDVTDSRLWRQATLRTLAGQD